LWQRTGGCGGSGWLPAHSMGPPRHGWLSGWERKEFFFPFQTETWWEILKF
jgi:hypothetical protein